ncbi:MAG: cytoplasmic protein [Deltaproteobacteria bacterium]|nr:cytoplasmic protein [Deltaproteobacteria bacterium]
MRDSFLNPTSNNRQSPDNSQGYFEEMEATELYCQSCGRAVPVNRFLLLILPDGDRYEYRCRYCGSKVGSKINRSGQFYGILRK